MNGPDEYKFPKEASTWAPYFQRRKEEKYHLDPGGANLVQSEVKRHLPLFEFRKGKKHTYITTVYLDTDKLEFFEKARSFYDDSLKVRIKEYCYRETESAPWLTFDNCFPEIKQRVHGLVVKRRFQLRKELLDRLLRGENIWEEMIALGNGTEFEGILEFYREFRWYVNRFKLRPKAIINYRRTVYQEDEQDLRITFDDDIVVYKPVPGLYRETGTLARSSLGEPARRFSHVTMEIKCQDGYPDWLAQILQTHRAERISKFISSLTALSPGMGEQDSTNDTTDQGQARGGSTRVPGVEN